MMIASVRLEIIPRNVCYYLKEGKGRKKNIWDETKLNDAGDLLRDIPNMSQSR